MFFLWPRITVFPSRSGKGSHVGLVFKGNDQDTNNFGSDGHSRH